MSRRPYRFSRHVENLVANLRGLPENHSPFERPVRDMGELVERLAKRHPALSETESLEDRIRDQWEAIVGPANARHCRPSRIERERSLVISVSNPVIRQELQFNKRHLLANLRSVKGGEAIRELIFKSG